MNKYADLLDKSINETNLSLTEISKRCEDEGIKVTVSYLSKLRNRKMPPPSFKITAALAKVLNANVEKLLAAGIYDNQIQNIIGVEEALKIAKPEYTQFQIKERTEGIVHRPEMVLNSVFSHYTSDFYESEEEAYKDMHEAYDAHLNVLTEETTAQYSTLSANMLIVPIVGKIAAGSAITAEENVESYITVENTWNLNHNEVFALRVKGDSMINSRINDGDIVIIKQQPEVENSEIAAVLVNETEATLKKVKRYENGETWLFPSNDNYAPIRIENENARILGKVIQVIFEP